MQNVTPISSAHLVSKQRATLLLVTSEDGAMQEFEAVVTRITPMAIRLALKQIPPVPFQLLYRWNRLVDMHLDLPSPHNRKAHARGVLIGLAADYSLDAPLVIVDIEFAEITEEEEKALRDSNPALVVS